MERYTDTYANALNNLIEAKRIIMLSVVDNLKCIAAKPIHIGNHWFYVVNHNGKDVPGYCHQRDYDPSNPKFLPIYDEDNSGEFGWSDFAECCRIFDLINKRLTNF